MATRILTCIILCAAACGAQTATTPTLTCENVNNTSASPRSNSNAPPANVSKLPIRSLLYRGSQTRIYARYMPWLAIPTIATSDTVPMIPSK